MASKSNADQEAVLGHLDVLAWLAATGSESRLNFLELLRAGHGDDLIDAEALVYMRERSLTSPVIRRVAEPSA